MIDYDNLNFQLATAEELKKLDHAITDYNIQLASELPRAEIQRLDFVVKDQENHLLGGIQAYQVNWGILHIELLFVFESYRKAKIGSKLLQYVEDIARKQGCYLAQLDTFDFQAKDFYLNLGYSIFGVLENCPKGHCRYYLKKDL